MEFEWDQEKRLSNLEKHGLDFVDAGHVFSDVHFQIEDLRRDYGETRYLVFGELDDRRVVIAWTPRGSRRRIVMMRHAHEEEFTSQKAGLD